MANQTQWAARGEVVVAMRHVLKYFDSLWGGDLKRTLTDANFEVRRGEVFGLLGPVGSGRSTSLKILAGLSSPTEGSARVFGRSPRSRANRRRTAYVPEGGQVRAVLTQALAKNPDLVLLDAPFATLEPGARADLKKLILSLTQRGKTVILTSQSLEEVKDLCDRVAVYDSGKVEAVGSVPELLATPAALRFLVPVVSSAIAQRMLQLLLEQLDCAASSNIPPAPPAEAVPLAGADPVDAAANEILARLIKLPAPRTRLVQKQETDSSLVPARVP